MDIVISALRVNCHQEHLNVPCRGSYWASDKTARGESVRKIVLVAGRGSLAGLKLAIGNSCLLSLDIVNCPVSPSTFVYSAEWILLKSSYFPH